MNNDFHSDTVRIAKNSAFLLVSRAVGISITLGMTVIIARYLGIQSFGLFAFVVAVSTCISPIGDVGLGRILCREIARDRTGGDKSVGTGLILKAGTALAVLAVSLAVLHFHPTWDRHIYSALVIAIVTELITSIGQTYLAVIRAFERMELELVTNTIYKLCSFAFVCVAVFLDSGLLGILYARLAGSIIYVALAAIFLYSRFLRPSLHFSASFAKYLIKESLPVAVFSILLVLIFKVDVFLLKYLGTNADVALYEVPHRLITTLEIFSTSICFAVFPVLSRASKDSSRQLLEQHYRTTFKVLLIIGMALASLLYLGGQPLILFLFGADFVQAALSLRIMAPTMLFLFLTSIQNSFLVATGRQVLNIASTGIALACNFVLDLLLIPDYAYVGACVGTLISYFILMAINALFVSKQGVVLRLKTDILKTVVAGLVMLFPLFIRFPSDIATLLLRFVLGLLIYVILLRWLKVLTREEAEAMKSILRTQRRKPPTCAQDRLPNADGLMDE